MPGQHGDNSHRLRNAYARRRADRHLLTVCSPASRVCTTARRQRAESFQGGTRTALIGVAIHVAVAFWWSAVFLVIVRRSPSVRRVLESPVGTIKIASVYGPFIWLVMSLAVIPLLVHRPPAITGRWWIQLLGHIPSSDFQSRCRSRVAGAERLEHRIFAPEG